jgi:RNA polymerase sigma-70 factor (ECF subfamily)
VFNLYVLDGYTHDEIAKMLNISEGTSKSNLSKARENLKKMLETMSGVAYAKSI